MFKFLKKFLPLVLATITSFIVLSNFWLMDRPGFEMPPAILRLYQIYRYVVLGASIIVFLLTSKNTAKNSANKNHLMLLGSLIVSILYLIQIILPDFIMFGFSLKFFTLDYMRKPLIVFGANLIWFIIDSLTGEIKEAVTTDEQ